MGDKDFFSENQPDLDPYDREARCRKAIRTIGKAIAVRVAAGILLLAAVVRAGAAPVALGLSVFALLVILTGVFPLVRELGKQRGLLKACLKQQEELEKKPGNE